MSNRETMQQALKALLDLQSLNSQDVWLDRWSEAIAALRETLAQPERCKPLDDWDIDLIRHNIGVDIDSFWARKFARAIEAAHGIKEQPLKKLADLGQKIEQEPVAFYHPRNGFYWAKPTSIFAPTSVDVEQLPLYTAVQRKWVGLTYEEIESAISDGFARGLDDGNISNQTVINYVRGIEAKLKELNNG